MRYFLMWVALVGAWIGTLGSPTTPLAQGISDTLSPDDRAELERIESSFRSGQLDSAATWAETVIERARQNQDLELEMLAQLHLASARSVGGYSGVALLAAVRAAELARALADSSHSRMASRWTAFSLLGLGRLEEATAEYVRLEQRSANDQREFAYAQFGLAYLAFRDGRNEEALDRYARAAELFALTDEPALELDARIGQARTLARLGRYGEMETLYQGILERSEATDQRRARAVALNNLGAREYEVGDPSLAVEYWKLALELHGPDAGPGVTLTPTMNLALAMMETGDFDGSARLLGGLIEGCESLLASENCAKVRMSLAEAEAARGRFGHAESLLRELVAADLPFDLRCEASLSLVELLHERDRDQEAWELLEELDQAAPLPAAWQLEADLVASDVLLALQLEDQALVRSEHAVSAAHALGYQKSLLRGQMAVARALRAAGRTEESLTELKQAHASWEALRAIPRDPQWREQRGTLGAEVHILLALALLEGAQREAAVEDSVTLASVGEAFELLQQFKTRTLLERMAGPDRYGQITLPPESQLNTLRSTALTPGEWLIDYHIHELASLAFIVGPRSIVVVELPAAERVESWAGLYLDMVGRGGHVRRFTKEQLDTAGERLRRELLAPVLAHLPTEAQLILCPDGILHALPLESWIEGSADAQVAFRTPSAAVLAAIRERREREHQVPWTLRVVEGGSTPGAQPLVGATREVKWLRRNVAAVEIWTPGPTPSTSSLLAGGIPVLHVATHSEAFAQRPWRSRIVLGSGADAVIEAGVIAQTPSELELAVLAGCATGAGRTSSGEGLLGLSTAFLSGGARCVVASLWPVEDRSTEALMREFYRGLEEGQPIAVALSAARSTVLAEDHSADAALLEGFVVLGDGSRRVSIRPKSRFPLALGGLGVFVIVILASWFWSRRRFFVIRPRQESP